MCIVSMSIYMKDCTRKQLFLLMFEVALYEVPFGLRTLYAYSRGIPYFKQLTELPNPFCRWPQGIILVVIFSILILLTIRRNNATAIHFLT